MLNNYNGNSIYECTGYQYECECEDCILVTRLYEQYDWLAQDKEFHKEELKEIEKEIERLGYSL